MASVRKRKWTHNGQEKEAWVVSYTDQGGKRRLKTFDKKKDADRYRIQMEGEIEAGVTAWNESVTVAQAAQAFLDDCDRRWKKGDITGATFANYRKSSRYFVDRFGHRRVSTLVRDELQDFIDEFRERYSSDTTRACHSLMFKIIRYSVRRRWVKRNILADDGLQLPSAGRRKRIPSREEVLRLLSASTIRSPNERLREFVNRYLFVRLGILCGLRSGEIYGLQWEDIDFGRDVIRVRHSLSVHDGIKATKSAAGNRTIPLSDPVRDALVCVGRFTGIYEHACDCEAGRDWCERRSAPDGPTV